VTPYVVLYLTVVRHRLTSVAFARPGSGEVVVAALVAGLKVPIDRAACDTFDYD